MVLGCRFEGVCFVAVMVFGFGFEVWMGLWFWVVVLGCRFDGVVFCGQGAVEMWTVVICINRSLGCDAPRGCLQGTCGVVI